MATFFSDFSAYSTGDIDTVSGGDFATQAAGGGDWTRNVTTDGAATGGKTLVFARTGSGTVENTVVCNALAGTSGDIEIVARFKTGSVPDSGYPLGPCLVDSTGACYAISWDGATTVDLNRINGGGAGTPASSIGSTSLTWAANTYYWIRIGRVGTTLHANIGTTEASVDPASWAISGTDATLTTVKAGIQTYEFGWAPYTTDIIGVGTGADHAPTAGGPPVTLEQEGCLWRADDGNETGATGLASQDTSITRASGQNTRLRVLVNATNDPSSTQYQLEYKLSSDSVYKKVEAAGGGSLAFGTIGAVTTAGTTAPTVAYPASIAAGDLLVLAIGNRPNAQTPATPSGWTALSGNSATGGAGTEGAGTGTMRCTVFIKEAAGTESGTLALSITSGTSASAVMWRVTKTTGKNWSVALASGSENTAGTAWSATMGSDPGVTSADLVYVASVSSEDTASFASEALTQTGVTFGTMVERADSAISTGNDQRLVLAEFPVSSGTSSAAAVYTMTASGTNSANAAGVSIMIRIRQIDQPIQLSTSTQFADSDATTAKLTAPSGKTTSDFVAGEMCETSNPAPAIDITSDDYTEIEWCLKATTQAANSDVYQFRVTENGTALDTYTVTPQWTIGIPTPPALPVSRLDRRNSGPFKSFRRETRSYYIPNTAVTVALSGQSATLSQGSIGSGTAPTLSGASITTAQGAIAPTRVLTLSGQASTFSQGTLTGDLSKALSGQSSSTSAGSLSPALALTPSGAAATFAQGIVSAGNDVTVALTGLSGTFAQEIIQPAWAKTLSGGQATFGQGTVSAGNDVIVALTGQEITAAQGSLSLTCVLALTGSVASFAQGSVVINYDRALIGQSGTVSAGTLALDASISLTGSGITSAHGNVGAAGDVTIALSGQVVTSAAGSVIVGLAKPISTQTVTLRGAQSTAVSGGSSGTTVNG